MRLTDAELRDALVGCPPGSARDKLVQELKQRNAAAAQRRKPTPTGRCGHQRSVYWDVKGAYSSGYICHRDDHSICEGGAGLEVEWDDQERPHLDEIIAQARPRR